MRLEDIISIVALLIVFITFALVTIIGFIAVKRFLLDSFGKVRKSEREAYTALLSSHEAKYHKYAEYKPKQEDAKTVIL